MRHLFAATSLGLMLASSPSWGQAGNPAAMAPVTPQSPQGMPAPNQPNENDQLFVREATIGGMAEVGLGHLAEQRGQSGAVKDFGRRMVQHHGTANDQLARLAHAANIPMPQGLDAEHKMMQEQLEKLSGAAFDVAYIRGQIQEHQKAAQLFAWELGSGQDHDLQRFAGDTLPIILDHLQIARQLYVQLTNQGPGLASATPRTP